MPLANDLLASGLALTSYGQWLLVNVVSGGQVSQIEGVRLLEN